MARCPMAQDRGVNPKRFFGELKRRNVYKVAIAYAVIAWLLIQAGSILFPTFEAPGWVMKVFVTVRSRRIRHRAHRRVGFRDDTTGNEAHRGPRAGRIHSAMEQAQIPCADRDSRSGCCGIACFSSMAHSEGVTSRNRS